jgi:hypothetical protein
MNQRREIQSRPEVRIDPNYRAVDGRENDQGDPRAGGRRMWLPLLVLAGLSLCAAGCGSGITDGGVPIGTGRAETSGQVVAAASPDQPLAGASVSLTAFDGSIYTTTTDAAGDFDFKSVPVGAGLLSVSPPAGSSLRSQTLPVDVTPDSISAVTAALPPAAAAFQVTSIVLAPLSLHLHVGGTATITAVVLGNNIPVGTFPALAVLGGVGHILRHGEFRATRIGSGTVVAVLEGQSASIPVTID